MKETVFVTMILRATLVDSASLNSVLLGSGKMFHRQAGHREQREKAVLGNNPRRKGP